MNISLIDHSRGYNLTPIELGCSIALLGTGGFYAHRHLQMAQRSDASKWHWVVALIEFIPIVGGIVALIEYALYRCGMFRAPILITEYIDYEEPYPQISPFLKTESCVALFTLKESTILPFTRPLKDYMGICYSSNKVFFEQLQFESSGPRFIEGLRHRIPPFKYTKLCLVQHFYIRCKMALTWPDLLFCSRTALYWAISWQNIPFIESIVTSKEGAHLLNHSYPLLTYYCDERPGLADFLEYPIHQALRIACTSTRENAPRAEQVVMKLLELNADINQADAIGRTPLHLALVGRKFSLVKFLLKEGGAVQITAIKDQITALLMRDNTRLLVHLYEELREEMISTLVDHAGLPKDISLITLRYLF